MKKRNNFQSWLATAIASAITVATVMTVTMPTAHADETDTVVTKSKTSHEVIDDTNVKFFSTPDGVIFEFNEIYDVEDGQNLEIWQRGREYSKGIYARVYESENEPLYVQEYETLDSWGTDGTFTFNGEEYNYNLVPPSKLRLEHRVLVEDLILSKLLVSPQKLAYFDYSKDGIFKVNDLVLLNQRLAATPMSSITNCDSVMYDQMDKDTFFTIIDSALKSDKKELKVYYEDKVPQKADNTWNIGIAKDVAGNEVIWYEVKKDADGDILIPSEDTMEKGSSIESGVPRVFEDKYKSVNRLLGMMQKMGVDEGSFKLVVSNKPICYSWVTTQFAYMGIANSTYQICPSEDINKFKYVFADRFIVGYVNAMVIDTTNLSDTIMWCPGEWMDYHPWYDNDMDVMEVDGNLTDMVIDLSGKEEYIIDKYDYNCYLSLIPNEKDVFYEFGSGKVLPCN